MIIMRNSPDEKMLISVDEVREYLMQAHAIFEQRGMLKQLKETKQKIKLLTYTIKNPMMSLNQNEINEIAASDRDDQEGGAT